MIKSIVLDLNGVFLQSDYLTDRLLKDYGIPVEESMKILKWSMPIVRLNSNVQVYNFWGPLLRKFYIDMNKESFLRY
jgi:hypothetical protein